jgi:hypothetical protein
MQVPTNSVGSALGADADGWQCLATVEDPTGRTVQHFLHRKVLFWGSMLLQV